jgi:hypothetical protein
MFGRAKSFGESAAGNSEFVDLDIPLERTPGFFNTPDTLKLGLIRIRLYFNPIKYQHYVYIRKENKKADAATDSFLSISCGDIGQVIEIFRTLLRELDLTPMDQLPLSILNATNNDDFSHRDYWDEKSCMRTDGNTLCIRSYRDNYGVYHIRILAPRESEKYKNWRGMIEIVCE